MHLSSLTLKGFKSFAQPTTFAFEPGVTCIVGPNGSGKSNVVDALAWVMGEQGVKNLRGGSMADVIFAGTATRGPLGRAEVVLTIDNADGALPIAYTEVAISRTLFRDGRSEYAINGSGVRLLDVQELLSDSGLGREMHVIVGQGRLDEVLRATPEERRGFVEEAAGVLKHRRRRERTVRKLDAMQANLTRLTDLAEELRRQLKPLGAQAEVAKEAAGIQAAVREARVRLLAVDATRLAASVAALEAEHEQVESARQVADDDERGLEARASALEAESAADGIDDLRRTALELERAQDRFRTLAQTVATRVALLEPDDGPVAQAETGAVERAEVVASIPVLEQRVAGARRDGARAGEDLSAAQAELHRVDTAIAEEAGLVAAHDRAVAEVERRAAGASSRAAAAAADAERGRAGARAARVRADAAAAAVEALPPVPDPTDPLAPEPAVSAAAAVAGTVADDARTALHEVERRLSAAEARVAALRSATAVPPSVAQVLDALPAARRLQDLLEIDPAWRTAVAAALGAATDAAVLPDIDALSAAAGAAAALGAVQLVAADVAGAADDPSVEVPGVVPARRVVRGPAGVLALLGRVVLAPDLDAARRAADAADVVAVSVTGEVVTASTLRTAGLARSGLELSAAREEAERDAARLREETDVARGRHREARRALDAARLEQGEAERAAAERARSERAAESARAALVARAESAAAEAERADAQARDAQAASGAADEAERAAEAAAADVRSMPRPQVDGAVRGPVAARVDAARGAALEARLTADTAAERLRSLRSRLAALDARARAAEAAADAAARRVAERAVQRASAEAVLAELPDWQAAVDRSLTEARVRLVEAERRRAEQSIELREARRRLADARAAAADLERRGRDLDMQAYEQRVSLGAVRDRALAEVGLDAAALAAEAVEGVDRQEEERRLASAERRLARLGRVNPLALEEFAALEQRHAFLGEQLADLRRTRADLLTIVTDLDERMRRIFAEAFTDTQEAFARVFPVLFPGGSGRLSLTEEESGEPGIEVAVRPAGKRIERLSLLSGGERSLAAVAFLLAIFSARPSPFYILDEVEAALDDANLGRLLEVVSALRDESQLILITHQKRTMEIADALYGVSMQQDGVSNVIGQRLAARA